MQYSKYGYTFGVEKMACGSWCAIGHAPGKHPYALTKLGTAVDEHGMQLKLVSWAKHVGATPVPRKAAVMSPDGTAVELELFPLRTGCLY